MHRICIKDIQKDIPVGEGICSVFLVGSAQKAEGKNGPFWSLKLRDATGTLDAKIWAPLSQTVAELKMGDFVEVKGRTSLFREQLQFTVDALRLVENPEELSMGDFIQTSAVEPAEILAQIEEKISEAKRKMQAATIRARSPFVIAAAATDRNTESLILRETKTAFRQL